MTSELSFIRQLKHLSQNYYQKYKDRLVSIVLAGSLAYRTESIENWNDMDIILVCKSYDLLLGKHFQKYLETSLEGFEVDAGVYPLSRIRREKSMLMYDVKNKGKILAGLDIRPLIAVKSEDLYPYEAFRLLLNRLAELVLVVGDPASDRIVVKEKLHKKVSDRIERAYVDSYLIFNKKYVTDPNEKRELFFSLNGKIPEVRTLEQCRTILLTALEYGVRKANFKSLHEMLDELRRKYKYPFWFRIYTLFKTGKISAVLHNPIFDFYESAVSFLEIGDTKNKALGIFAKNQRRMWERSPQPIIVK